jgi:hypothetical protein
MFKFYSDLFRFKESTLSRASIRRLWILLGLSLPFVPLLLLLRLNLATELPALEAIHSAVDGRVGYSIFVVSFLAWVVLLSTRGMNRFWARDRYLDEWEVQTKRASMTFAFQVISYLWAALFLIVLIIQNFSPNDGVGISLLTISVTALFLSIYAQIFFLLTKLRVMDETNEDKSHSTEIHAT